MLSNSFRLALLAICLAAPLLLAGQPGCPDDYRRKPCPPVAACFRPAGCNDYDKKGLIIPPPVCLTGCDPYCRKPIPLMKPLCQPACHPTDGGCPPGWFGLKRGM
ncbi:MAG: hypothetical protein NTV55_03110 [Planctomycetota bacterium]|nr:hypothetical protein [Planctomycetota bacterium]